MRILIVGGTGNISTAITRVLLKDGHDVTLVKRSAALPEELRAARVITVDRTNASEFAAKLADAGTWDCVLDMVCYEPADAQVAANTFKGRARQYIFCSTVDAYSKTPHAYPVTEVTAVLGALPSFPYGHKKMQCEQILWSAHADGDLALTVIRPTFTYNETWSPGIHSFGGQTYHLDRIRRGKPIIMHGDGTSLWVATHRDDVARAFVKAIGLPKAIGEAYHFSGDECMTHNEIWKMIARLIKAPEPDFVYIPSDLLGRLAPKEAEWCVENFRHNNVFDSSKARRELDFRYTMPFEQGAARCIQYLMEQGKIEDSGKFPFYDRIVDAWRVKTREMEALASASAGQE